MFSWIVTMYNEIVCKNYRTILYYFYTKWWVLFFFLTFNSVEKFFVNTYRGN